VNNNQHLGVFDTATRKIKPGGLVKVRGSDLVGLIVKGPYTLEPANRTHWYDIQICGEGELLTFRTFSETETNIYNTMDLLG